jgi:hypothetical protein
MMTTTTMKGCAVAVVLWRLWQVWLFFQFDGMWFVAVSLYHSKSRDSAIQKQKSSSEEQRILFQRQLSRPATRALGKQLPRIYISRSRSAAPLPSDSVVTKREKVSRLKEVVKWMMNDAPLVPLAPPLQLLAVLSYTDVY